MVELNYPFDADSIISDKKKLKKLLISDGKNRIKNVHL